MSGHASPLRCCDSYCATVNNCIVGGVRCDRCGSWHCSGEMSKDERGRYLCVDCEREEEGGEE